MPERQFPDFAQSIPFFKDFADLKFMFSTVSQVTVFNPDESSQYAFSCVNVRLSWISIAALTKNNTAATCVDTSPRPAMHVQ